MDFTKKTGQAYRVHRDCFLQVHSPVMDYLLRLARGDHFVLQSISDNPLSGEIRRELHLRFENVGYTELLQVYPNALAVLLHSGHVEEWR